VSDVLLDASALLALLHEEVGMEVVQAALPRASISAVNAAEVMAVMAPRLGAATAMAQFRAVRLLVLPFTGDQAEEAQRLLSQHNGAISLGDAACLAKAAVLRMPAMTGDRIWATLDLGIELRLIRP